MSDVVIGDVFSCRGKIKIEDVASMRARIDSILGGMTEGAFGGLYPTSSNLIPETYNILVEVKLTDVELQVDKAAPKVLKSYAHQSEAIASFSFCCPGITCDESKQKIRGIIRSLVEKYDNYDPDLGQTEPLHNVIVAYSITDLTLLPHMSIVEDIEDE